MGAAGLIDIKRRIKSVQSTRKITNAMGLVATSKLRKSKKEFNVNHKFLKSLESIVESLMVSVPSEDNIYFKGNNSEEKLYIAITSESGLCGGFNNNVITYLDYITRKERENSKVIIVGKRGLSYIKKTGLETVAEYVDISDLPTVKEAKDMFEKALKMYKDGEVSEVKVVFCEFISPVKQEPRCVKLLPIEKVEGKAQECVIEPDVKTVFNDSINLYLNSKMRSILLSSKCSEQSARMTAMDGATQNANDLLDGLNLTYNRIRQGMITQEISEIVGGAEAQK